VLRVAFALGGIVFTGTLVAHPEIEDALVRLNAQISAAPNDAELYLQRGELYARHDEWIVAEANYLRAAELAPQHPRLDRARGAIALATGRFQEARTFFNAALGRSPDDAETLVLRARAHAALKSNAAAVADFNRALALIAEPPPELFLERAALLAPLDAIRSLDEGLARLGAAVSLHVRAIALEESLGRIDAAAARFAILAEQSERKEGWLKRQGDLLARAGRQPEARVAYEAALAAIAALPAWLRSSPDATKLAAELVRLTSSRS
jgi:tetratricopeptide (TPR) repeat protein